jgi:NitT/TauT family transport system substrate-binding protein
MNNMKIGGVDDFYTNALIDEINQFDREEIKRQALSYA